jgi:hypothetical protein
MLNGSPGPMPGAPCVIVANRVTGLSKAASQPAAWRREVESIEEVIHFDPQLGVDSFHYLRVFHGRKSPGTRSRVGL